MDLSRSLILLLIAVTTTIINLQNFERESVMLKNYLPYFTDNEFSDEIVAIQETYTQAMLDYFDLTRRKLFFTLREFDNDINPG
jgi:hypothetical protein